MEISRGMQVAVQAFVKMLGLDPNRVQASMDGIAKSLYDAAAEMRLMRERQDMIMKHLGLMEIKADDGQHSLALNGSGARGTGSASDAGAGN